MHLLRTPELAGEVDALADRHGGRVGLDAVLADLDRRLWRTWAPCPTPHRAWTWDRRDRRDRQWWPQGVCVRPGGRLLAVSWYARGGASRVSFLAPSRRRYRHVQLVVPTETGHRPLAIHAGGLAWHGSRLYLAATRAGLWVCDTGDIVRAGADYLLPVRHRLAPQGVGAEQPLRFSFVSIEHARRPPGLIVGEYGHHRQTRRLAQVSIGGGPVAVINHGVHRAQGAVRVGGRLYLTASHGRWGLGSVWRGEPGDLRERRWALPMGPEDLTHDPHSDRLWTLTEHPGRRWVLSVRRSRWG